MSLILTTPSQDVCMQKTHCQGTHYLDSAYMPAKEMKSRRNTLTRQPSRFLSVTVPNIAFAGRCSKVKKSVAGKLASLRLARREALRAKATRYACILGGPNGELRTRPAKICVSQQVASIGKHLCESRNSTCVEHSGTRSRFGSQLAFSSISRLTRSRCWAASSSW